jgi:hypothetical protein
MAASSTAYATDLTIDGGNMAFTRSVLTILKLRRPMNAGNLLRKVAARANKVASKVLINNGFGGK